MADSWFHHTCCLLESVSSYWLLTWHIFTRYAHGVKIVVIQSFSGPVFCRSRSEYRKTRTRLKTWTLFKQWSLFTYSTQPLDICLNSESIIVNYQVFDCICYTQILWHFWRKTSYWYEWLDMDQKLSMTTWKKFILVILLSKLL